MSASEISISIRVIDNFSSAVGRAIEAMLRWQWATWWLAWGTDGWKRQSALVIWTSR